MKKTLLFAGVAALLFAMASCSDPAADGKKMAEQQFKCMMVTTSADFETCKEQTEEMKDEFRKKYKGDDAQEFSKACGERLAELMNENAEELAEAREKLTEDLNK